MESDVDSGKLELEVHRLQAELCAARYSAQQLREEARAAERTKNEFLANISHEIRTPMNAILGFSRMLLKEGLPPAQTEKLEYVHDAAESLLHLISNVLDYSKLAAGELKISHTPFDLDSVIRDVLATAGEQAGHKGLSIGYHVQASVPQWLIGDKTRIRQIVSNLVSNAVKFTEQGEIHIRVSLDESDQRSATIRLEVTDTGIGIPDARQQVIFDSFAQADGSSTRQFGGLGLGLSICKQLVRLMGGQIGFRSTFGAGSNFWVTLPLRVHRNVHTSKNLTEAARIERRGQYGCSKPATGSNDREQGSRRTQPRVLLAEDDKMSQTLVEMLLGRAGCLVEVGVNGREALAMANHARYDLILMDVEMPEVDGLEAIRELRRGEEAAGGHTPIISLTADALPGDRERCLEAGADEYLPKPFTPETLLDAVARFLPGRLELFEPHPPATNRVDSRSDPPHLLQECFQAICRALGDRDFHRLESSAGRLKTASLEAGAKPIADNAMRLQLAARSSDLDGVTIAVKRLQSILHPRTVQLKT